MCNQNEGADNNAPHTTAESTGDRTHSDIETLDELVEELSNRADEARENAGLCTGDESFAWRAKRAAYNEAASLVQQFSDNLETDIWELRAEADDLLTQINGMEATAAMLSDGGDDEQTSDPNTRRVSDRELAADAIPDGLRAFFDGLETQRGADGSLNQIEVHVAVGTSQPKNHVVGYHVDGEVARPLDIGTPFVEDGVFGLSALAAIPVANEAVETHVDDITRTVALPEYVDELHAHDTDDDTPGLLELGQEHGAVTDDHQDVQADGGYVRQNDLPSYDISLELVRYRDGDDVKMRWQASADRSETTAADEDPATAVDILLNALEEEAREWVEDGDGETDIRADGGRGTCSECGATLPEEIDEGTGVYCPNCGLGQHVGGGA